MRPLSGDARQSSSVMTQTPMLSKIRAFAGALNERRNVSFGSSSVSPLTLTPDKSVVRSAMLWLSGTNERLVFDGVTV